MFPIEEDAKLMRRAQISGALSPREKPCGEGDGRANGDPGKITAGAFGEQRSQ